MPIENIIANGYNLDIKNPNTPEDRHEDPVELLKKYQEATAKADNARLALKQALQACLEKGG